MTTNPKPSLEEKVLERISGQRPHSRWYFLLRNGGMWFLAALSVVLGAFAVSSLIFRAVNLAPALGSDSPPLPEIILALPFLWIIVMGVFGYLAYREIRATKRGYKYAFSTLLLSMLLASVVLGSALFATGAGFILDRFAVEHVPFHSSLERVQRDRWQRPEEGFLVGTIEHKNDDDSFELIDVNKLSWTVELASEVLEERIESLTVGERVGVRGTISDADTHVFHACDIRSLEFEGRGQRPPAPQLFLGRNASSTRSTGCEDVRPPVTR